MNTDGGQYDASVPDAPATSPSSVPTLNYQPEYSEERLPDGTLRITVTHERTQALKVSILMLGGSILGSIILLLLWYFTGSMRALIYALAFGPLLFMLGGLLALLQLRTPRRQTHIVEIHPDSVVIQTAVMGSPATYRHARSDVLAIRCNGMALELHVARRGAYSCLAFVNSKHLKSIADTLNRELAIGPA